MLVAKDSRRCPGAPKPEPGTPATSASVQQEFAERVVVGEAQLPHGAADIGEGVERAGAGPATDAGQGVEARRRRNHARCRNDSFMRATSCCGPFSAAMAACWLMLLALVVDWPWMVAIAAMTSAGPPQ